MAVAGSLPQGGRRAGTGLRAVGLVAAGGEAAKASADAVVVVVETEWLNRALVMNTTVSAGVLLSVLLCDQPMGLVRVRRQGMPWDACTECKGRPALHDTSGERERVRGAVPSECRSAKRAAVANRPAAAPVLGGLAGCQSTTH